MFSSKKSKDSVYVSVNKYIVKEGERDGGRRDCKPRADAAGFMNNERERERGAGGKTLNGFFGAERRQVAKQPVGGGG